MDYSNIIYSFLTSSFPIVFANSSSDFYSAESMGYITTRERAVFFSLFLLLYIAAILGNTAAIFSTCKRKHRYIQKTLVVSLALSDLIMATSYAVQYLNTFAHALLNWTMGEIMCFLIPFLQLFGVVASSGAILIIALDRYRSAVHATMNRWNPNIMLCLFGITLLWCTAAALAYPSQILILYRKVIIVSTDDDGNQSYMDGYICITTEKYNVIVYYASITIIVFLPLVVMVLWLYYNICKLVWNQKKPKIDSGAKVQSSNDTTRSILKNSQSNIITAPQRRNFQNERRIRIFKIMILLILAFIVCRMPHWIYRTIKASYNYVDNQEWVTAFVLSSLIFLNCILNPFLYTFLPETITKIAKIWKTISNFTCEVCCCCCSNSEFEQFEKENPFSVENYDREKRINKQPNKDVRVKFEDTSTVQCNTNKY